MCLDSQWANIPRWEPKTRLVYFIHYTSKQKPDSARGWALVFLLGPCEGQTETGCRVVLLRESWFISTKGVAYGPLI